MRYDKLLTGGTLLMMLFVLWPIFNSAQAEAKLDVVTFKDILNSKISTEKYTDNFSAATDKVQEKIDSMHLGFDVDVKAVVAGDFSSIASQDLSPIQMVNLAGIVSSAQDTTYQELNTATRKATETAYINQISNSSFGDSIQDLKTEMDAMQKVINDMNQQVENVKKLYQGINIVMGAKEAFMQEKYDYPKDALMICNDYMPGGDTPIFPKLTDGVEFNLELPKFDNEDIFEKVKDSVNYKSMIQKQYQNISNPAFVEVYEKGDLTALMKTAMSPAELAQASGLDMAQANELLEVFSDPALGTLLNDYGYKELAEMSPEKIAAIAGIDISKAKRLYDTVTNTDYTAAFEKTSPKDIIAGGQTAAKNYMQITSEAGLAADEAAKLRKLNTYAEAYEREAQAVEHYNLKMKEQFDNFNKQSTENLKLIIYWQMIIENGTDLIKPPTT